MDHHDTPSRLELFDTHAHLDFAKFESDFDEVLQRAKDAGVGRIVSIGASSGDKSNLAALALANRFDHIYASVGIHPHNASLYSEERMAKIRGWVADNPKVVAVGESGLDYFYDRSPREIQRASFEAHVALAQETGKPLIVHTRDAEDDTIDFLADAAKRGVIGIIHCFSGTKKLAEAALDAGFFLSFSGIVTFPSAQTVQDVAKTAPLDRVLVETDAPFLAPAPMRGKRNEPAFVAHTLRHIASLRDISPSELAKITTQNACRVYGLPST